MKNKTVLVTGAKGFIGSNLVKRFQSIHDIDLIEFNRDGNLLELEEQIKSVDFIFHFAGEVRPKSSDYEFEKSNAILTKSIIDIIEKNGKKIPFLMLSSTHAKLQKNAYGKTKREAEVYLEEYGKRNGVSVWIYRLTHVFGEGCKPNYNSVISTWIYNSIRNEEEKNVVFDRAITMTYIYVQDLIKEFIECLKNEQKDSIADPYIYPKITYSTTLGEIIDLISKFKNIEKFEENGLTIFEKKLFNTYQDYYTKKVSNNANY